MTYALQNLTRAGDHIVAEKTLYGGTYNLLAHTFPTWGVSTTFVEPEDPAAYERAVTPATHAIYVESLGNPHSNPVDFDALAALAHSHGIPLVVDNTLATPWLLGPSNTARISLFIRLPGSWAAMGGVIVDSGTFDWKASGKFPQLIEPCPSYHGLSFVDAAGPAASG